MPNYNKIVWFYDFVARLIFGNKLIIAERTFLGEIKDNDKVLIIGGGTGEIIAYLNELKKHLTVDYVDISSKMMREAKKREGGKLSLSFYQQSILDFDGQGYDIIIANFFFDQFKQDKAQEIANYLHKKLKPSGILLFSDFIISQHIVDKILLFMMILFIRLTAHLAITTLPNYDQLFATAGFKKQKEEVIGENIRAAVYSVAVAK